MSAGLLQEVHPLRVGTEVVDPRADIEGLRSADGVDDTHSTSADVESVTAEPEATLGE
jgi:hypothetical protein